MNHNDKKVVNDKNTLSNKVADYRIWIHRSNSIGGSLFSVIDKNLLRIKQQSSTLSGENRAIKQNKKIRKIKVIINIYLTSFIENTKIFFC